MQSVDSSTPHSSSWAHHAHLFQNPVLLTLSCHSSSDSLKSPLTYAPVSCRDVGSHAAAVLQRCLSGRSLRPLLVSCHLPALLQQHIG